MKTHLLLLTLLVATLGAKAQSVTIEGKHLELDDKHLLLNAYASPEQLANPRIAATLQTLGELSADQRTLTLPAGTTVYVAPGVYWTDLTYRQGFPFDESGFVIARPNVGLTILGDDISFIGLTDDPSDVHICGNRGEGGAKGLGASGSWYTLAVSTGFRAENLTIANYAQEDLVYPRDPSQNISKRINSTNHAEVLRNAAPGIDRIYMRNVHFVGYLNMMAGFSPLRAYWKDCTFQCTDDALFGGGVNVYDRCTFHLYGGHPSAFGAAPGGINALLGCTFMGMPSMAAGRQLHFNKVSRGNGADASSIYAIIDCYFDKGIASVEWENFVRPDARHAVSNNTIGEDRKPLVISPDQPQTSVVYSGEALHAFKVGDEYNVYNLLKGSDGWNPAGQDLTQWAPYSNLPYRFLIGATNTTLYSYLTGADNTTVLTPAAAPAGSIDGSKTIWEYDQELLDGRLDAATGVLTLSAKPRRSGGIVHSVVTGTLPNGISAGATLAIRPLPPAAPALSSPAIAIDRNEARLSYELVDLGYKDASTIDWYRETSPTSTDGIHIGTTRNDSAGLFVDEPYKKYELTKYDVGYYLRAVITPKLELGHSGTPVSVRTERAIRATDVTHERLETTFKNVYITHEDPRTTTGRWFFDNVGDTALFEPWGWGVGTNGAEGRWGLMNNTRGKNTRMVFAQTGSYGDMSLRLDYSPGKTGGQGFGGSGGYLDIYIKYDAATRSGYGLRVERVPATTSGTQWTLYRFDADGQTALTEGVLSTAFMPRSVIVVEVVGNTLRVEATTRLGKTQRQLERDLPETVDLSWSDPTGELGRNESGGFGFRINNSGNASYIYGGAGTNNCVMLDHVQVTTQRR